MTLFDRTPPVTQNPDNPLLSDPQPLARGEVVEVNGGRYQVVEIGTRFVRLQGVTKQTPTGRGADVIEHPPIPGVVCMNCGGVG